jgi:hypothetical protein
MNPHTDPDVQQVVQALFLEPETAAFVSALNALLWHTDWPAGNLDQERLEKAVEIVRAVLDAAGHQALKADLAAANANLADHKQVVKHLQRAVVDLKDKIAAVRRQLAEATELLRTISANQKLDEDHGEGGPTTHFGVVRIDAWLDQQPTDTRTSET